MTITYPTTLDTFSNPTGTDLLENVTSALDHDVQHSNANDAIEALEAKVGVTGSAVTTSHDYKLSGVTGSDKAVSKTGTETLTNKTLTAPKITAGSDAKGDIFQLSDGTGVLARIRATLNADIISWNSATQQWEAIPNPAGSNASTTVKGVVELATYAETIARTTTGATGALLVVTPDNLTTVQTYDYAADAVGTDSYAITVVPAPTAYAIGQTFRFKAATANTGGATLNVNGLGAKAIVRGVNTTLADGDIAANMLCTVMYDGTNFVLQSPTANVSSFIAKFTNGATSRAGDTASGTQNIAHGLGVIPKFIRITAIKTLGSGTGQGLSTSFGAYNGTTNSCVYSVSKQGTAAGTGSTSGNSTTNAIYIVDSSASSEIQSVVITVDATNIILTWTKTSTPTADNIQIQWEARA